MPRIFILLSIFSLISCHIEEKREVDSSPYFYEKPLLLNDGINTASADLHSINTGTLTDLVNSVRQGEIRGLDSIVISKNSDLILEEYFAGWTRDDIHDLRSATKSITGLLAGIAIDQQLLRLDTFVYPHFAENYPVTDNWTPDKNKIQLKDFMNMSSGLACNDDDSASPGNESKMYRYRDWVKFILDLPMVRRPGVWFSYCTGGVQVVARMIENASGSSLSEYARNNLFDAMGINKYLWSVTGSGRTEGSGHIYMRSRDMLKLGLMVLNNGQWKGQQLVSTQWIAQLHDPFYKFYGYFWWHQTFRPDDASYPETNAIYASGNGGQQIWIFPDLEMVVVFTANNYDQKNVSGEIIKNYILPAVYGL